MRFKRLAWGRAGSLLLVLLWAVTGARAVELRLDAVRLGYGVQALSGAAETRALGVSLDIPTSGQWHWGPRVDYFAGSTGQVHRLGVQATRYSRSGEGIYLGTGVDWLGIVESSGETMADVCRPALPLYLTGRWGYRWQISQTFNAQFGVRAGVGQVTQRQAERCALDGTELDAGALQTFVEPRLDLAISARL